LRRDRELDRTNNLDSPGAVLWTRFADLSNGESDFLTSYIGAPALPMWKQPFDVNDPVNTPRGLNPAYAPAQTALADAVKQLRAAGIPLMRRCAITRPPPTAALADRFTAAGAKSGCSTR
jgi:hypothetical protein